MTRLLKRYGADFTGIDRYVSSHASSAVGDIEVLDLPLELTLLIPLLTLLLNPLSPLKV